jgi:hypothetical protein
MEKNKRLLGVYKYLVALKKQHGDMQERIEETLHSIENELDVSARESVMLRREETGIDLPLSLDAKGDIVMKKNAFGVSKEIASPLTGRMSEGLIEEYKALLELQMEAVDVVVDVGHALEEVEAHLNAVGVTIIAV